MTKIGLMCCLLLLGRTLFAQQAPAQMPLLAKVHNVYVDNQSFQKALPTSGRAVFIFYDPGCGHCQELGDGLAKNIDKLQHVAFFFISMNDKEYVDAYINMFAKGLKSKKNVSFWKDDGVEFIEKFNPENYPALYIYDVKTKKLVKSFQGESKMSKVMPFL